MGGEGGRGPNARPSRRKWPSPLTSTGTILPRGTMMMFTGPSVMTCNARDIERTDRCEHHTHRGGRERWKRRACDDRLVDALEGRVGHLEARLIDEVHADIEEKRAGVHRAEAEHARTDTDDLHRRDTCSAHGDGARP